MSFFSALMLIIKYLPYIFKLIERIDTMTKQGMEDAAVRKAMRDIDKAMDIKEPRQRAAALNDVFKN